MPAPVVTAPRTLADQTGIQQLERYKGTVAVGGISVQTTANRPAVRRAIETALSRLPLQTAQGIVTTERRPTRFGYPAGRQTDGSPAYSGKHEDVRAWVYQRRNSDLEMLFSFYRNFTEHDLICKVIMAGREISTGEGASVQFNSNKCFGRNEISHSLSFTVKHGIGRATMVAGMKRLAPEAAAALGSIDSPMVVGFTDDVPTLLDRLFLFCFAVEQVKRSIRREPPLPSLQAAVGE